MFRNKGDAPLWNFRMKLDVTSRISQAMAEVRRPRTLLGCFVSQKDYFIDWIECETLDTFCVKKCQGKAKQWTNLPQSQLIACQQCLACGVLQLTTVSLTAERATSAPRCPKHARLTARRLCSLLLLGLSPAGPADCPGLASHRLPGGGGKGRQHAPRLIPHLQVISAHG